MKDMDGDGAPDLAASIGWGVEGYSAEAGLAIFYGPAEPGVMTTDCANARIDADDLYYFSANSLQTGDFNGDGFSDVTAGIGAKYVFYGPVASGEWSVLDADAIVGEDEVVAGNDVAAGDIDGDGFDDLVVGGQWETVNSFMDGAVYVYYGGP